MNANSPQTHITVLLEESVSILNIQKGNVVVDGTFGGGGHSARILEQYPDISLICVDLDEAAKDRFEAQFGNKKNVHFVSANFKSVSQILAQAQRDHADRVLLDLGTSTFQLLGDTRGFSFNSATPLQMTFATSGSHTGFDAYDIVNTWEADSIADILFYYGEEKASRKIAAAIVAARAITPIVTSDALAALITEILPRRGKIHPATKTFQALRIAVNDELKVLEEALDAWWHILPAEGRIAVITFHSLEDRIVKRWMKNQQHQRVITKKPITPARQELQINPRSRSAKLRAIEKI